MLISFRDILELYLSGIHFYFSKHSLGMGWSESLTKWGCKHSLGLGWLESLTKWG